MRIQLSPPPDFSFLPAVCSYGFFMLAPNRWEASRKTLRTVVTLSNARSMSITLRMKNEHTLVAISGMAVTAAERKRIRERVRHILRLDEDFFDFHERCLHSRTHHDAARLRFGRLIRSETLFEDVVKVICTCNVTWRQTIRMVEQLVHHWGVPSDTETRSFPTPDRLARVKESELKTKARVGYRASSILRLARGVKDGSIDLNAFADETASTDELFKSLKRLPGIGDYGAANLCMLLGRYDRVAVDTELMRHLRERYPRRTWTARTAQAHYDRWAPYQFLAYWYELWRGYVDRHGDADTWEADGQGRRLTSDTSPR